MRKAKIYTRALVIEKKIKKYIKKNKDDINIFSIIPDAQGLLRMLEEDGIPLHHLTCEDSSLYIKQFISKGDIERALMYVEWFEEIIRLLKLRKKH